MLAPLIRSNSVELTVRKIFVRVSSQFDNKQHLGNFCRTYHPSFCCFFLFGNICSTIHKNDIKLQSLVGHEPKAISDFQKVLHPKMSVTNLVAERYSLFYFNYHCNKCSCKFLSRKKFYPTE